MDTHGEIEMSGTTVRASGESISAEVKHSFELSHVNADGTPNVTFRALSDLVISHVPLQVPKLLTPSDERIKTDIKAIDHEDIFHRLQDLQLKSFKYDREWGEMMGVDDETVRGLIAQEVTDIFPEYVTVKSEFHLTENGLRMENFTQINQQAIIVDLLAALQAQQKRISILKNSPVKNLEVQVPSIFPQVLHLAERQVRLMFLLETRPVGPLDLFGLLLAPVETRMAKT
ncbi:hypothetical protein DYB28_007699 [Aphanomyces astaci]|uniref:Peptidase S74 domain-containing protein n=1 Tax=Aphanomyces astaci TaxID=112090 RepID=A0A9X8E303_APHAT|nr:hypothetical protein DYB28_007699 [Aphanomyces astaci]